MSMEKDLLDRDVWFWEQFLECTVGVNVVAYVNKSESLAPLLAEMMKASLSGMYCIQLMISISFRGGHVTCAILFCFLLGDHRSTSSTGVGIETSIYMQCSE